MAEHGRPAASKPPVAIGPGDLSGRDRYRLPTSLVNVRATGALCVNVVTETPRLGGTGYMLPGAFREIPRP